MSDKKQTQEIFLFNFKMGGKTAETTHIINNTFVPGTANQHTVQWCFRKFCKGDESLEDERSGRASEADNDKLRAIIEADPPTTMTLKNTMSTVLGSFSIWSKLERWKTSISGCLMSWLKIKKIIVLKSCLLLFCTTSSLFSIGLWRAMKSGLYTITSNDQLRGWTKKKLQSTS